MGEAKRRKQILKENYGKKISKLKPGSPLFNNHAKNFSLGFAKKLGEINKKYLPNQPAKIEEETFKTWVKDYLSKYQKSDQETMVTLTINLVYKSFEGDNLSPNSDINSLLNYIVTIVFVHKVLNSFLSEETALAYTESLKTFYYEIMKTVPKEIKEGEEEEAAEIESMVEQIKQNMAEFLELED